jgi:hypothetical protein
MSQPTIVYQSGISHNLSLLSAGVYRIVVINVLAMIAAGRYSWLLAAIF